MVLAGAAGDQFLGGFRRCASGETLGIVQQQNIAPWQGSTNSPYPYGYKKN